MEFNVEGNKPMKITINFDWIIDQLNKRLPNINSKDYEEVIKVLKELDEEQNRNYL